MKDDLDPRLGIATIIRKTGWTYDQLLEQPDWLIESFGIISEAEELHQKDLGGSAK